MKRRLFFSFLAVSALSISGVTSAVAQDTPLKVGIIMPMSGQFGLSGKQVVAGARLYLHEQGGVVDGKKIELIVRDDTGSADMAKRLAKELVVNEKVDVLAGFGLTPMALSVAPVATQSKTPMVVMVAATSKVINASPYIVRSSFTMPQVVSGIAKWAPKHDLKRVMTLVTDYAPGYETEDAFHKVFKENGGEVVGSIRVPLSSPDFAPILERVLEKKPDALFVFLNPSYAITALKQIQERGIRKAGIKVIGTGDMVAEDVLNKMGDEALGVITSFHYSAAHPGAINAAFVDGYRKGNGGVEPNFMSVAGYDGMHIIYNAFKKTGGIGGGDALLKAMKGQHFESPRGPVTIDEKTGDIIQNVYLRKVERKEGSLSNIEFETLHDVKP